MALWGDVPGPDPLPIPKSTSFNPYNLLEEVKGNLKPIKDGHLTAPDIGGTKMLGAARIDIDLLLGKATAGFVGLDIYPWLRLDMEGLDKKIELEKNAVEKIKGKMSEQLDYSHCKPTETNSKGKVLTTSNEWLDWAELPLQEKTVEWSGKGKARLEDPTYKFLLKLRPGLGPEVWLDVGIYDDNWSWGPWYFPWGLESPDFTLDRHVRYKLGGTNTYSNCGFYFEVVE